MTMTMQITQPTNSLIYALCSETSVLIFRCLMERESSMQPENWSYQVYTYLFIYLFIYSFSFLGGAEIARPDIAGPDNAAKIESAQCPV